ncbi:MAG: hypothetical protein HY059_04965 [Proteobacteria bacterium]|nr:hypothetical protein [Pseudomonadota bacterium]
MTPAVQGLSVSDALARLLGYFEEEFRRLGPEGEALKVDALLAELSAFIVQDWAQLAFQELPPDHPGRAQALAIREAAARACLRHELGQAKVLERDPISANTYLSEVSRLAHTELEQAGVTKRSRILFIGSGAFPVTAITLARKTGCRILGIDVDREAVAQSRELIRLLRLGELMEFALAPVGRGVLESFSHVFIASLVPDKEDLLDELHAKIGPETIVLARYGNGLKSLLNYELGGVPLDRWRLLHKLADPRQLYDAVLLQKAAL